MIAVDLDDMGVIEPIEAIASSMGIRLERDYVKALESIERLEMENDQLRDLLIKMAMKLHA